MHTTDTVPPAVTTPVKTTPPPAATTHEARMQRTMSWVIVVTLAVFGIAGLIGIVTVGRTEGTFWQSLVSRQFPVIVGLPLAGCGALFVTLVLRLSSGPIRFQVAGVKFRGASAPIVFWLLCFLSIATMIKLLWLVER